MASPQSIDRAAECVAYFLIGLMEGYFNKNLDVSSKHRAIAELIDALKPCFQPVARQPPSQVATINTTVPSHDDRHHCRT